MKKELIILSATFLASLTLIVQSLMAGSEARIYLPIFFLVGLGLGGLRLFVNNSIKKMKGKPLTTKILFFVVLLGIGIPFQTWFRVNILMAMNSDILPRSIAILALGAVFLSFYVVFSKKRKLQRVS